MHLLKYQGYELQRGGLEGPDIICKKDGKTFLIECMLVENWEKGGRGNAYYSSHEEDKILKYTGAIVEKGKQFEKWSEKKLIPANSIRIIAIGGALQSLSDIHTGIPDIVKSVYPIGNSYYSVPLDGPERYLVNHEPRNRIIKVSGAEIPTDLFLKEKFQNISGLIYNPYSILQRDVSEGKGYIVVSNHGAEESIPINLIIGSLFYYIDDKGNLRHKSVE
ncbi:hypothetical protein [Leptospira broomii]|nr:hypothetical protein [Leptospira broomii]